MSSETFHKLHIEVVGDSGVGKTSLIQRFIEGTFSEDMESTSGICEFECVIIRRKMFILLMLRVFSLNQSPREVCGKLFRRADAVIIVFSCGDRLSFSNLANWQSHIRSSVGNKYVCVIGTKSDLENREVSSEEIRRYSEVFRSPAYETSALTGTGVRFAFLNLVDHLLDRVVPRSSFFLQGRIARPLFGNCVCPFPWPRGRPGSTTAARREPVTGDTNPPAEEEQTHVLSSTALNSLIRTSLTQSPAPNVLAGSESINPFVRRERSAPQ